MSRIAGRLAELKTASKKALIPYFVSGDPSLSATVDMMHALVDSGADILELGVGFSDPMAEGPTIQLAHERALANKVSLRDTLAMVAEFRQTDTTTPVVLMGYANPIEVMGYQRFAEQAKAAGVDGVLVVDLPPEEADQFQSILSQFEIDNIFLIAPTTEFSRVQKIVKAATGYFYYVSLKGVTGAGHMDVDSVKSKLAEIRTVTDLPLCVGFGIKDADSARQIAALADGAVVGSAIVDRIAQADSASDAIASVKAFTQTIREAIN